MAYKMTHPASDVEIEVDAGSVPMYETQGWETKPNAKPVDLPVEKAPKK